MNSTFHALLPKKLSSKLMYHLARIQIPWFKNLAIKAFMRVTGANLAQAEKTDINEYTCLLDFFTRSLKADARPITAVKKAVASPVDGCVSHVGDILDEQIFQIKGYTYSLTDLVGEQTAKPYYNGQATTLYLAPFDYHRIHAPIDGKLLAATYFSGQLNSVSITLLDKIAGLFAKNERVVLEFEHPQGFSYLMVLVGAVNVGSIETVFHGQITPRDDQTVLNLPVSTEQVVKGQEIGRFNLGSTVIFITPKGTLDWQIADGQNMLMGQMIGLLNG